MSILVYNFFRKTKNINQNTYTMKINGKLLVNPIMSQMQEGQEGFLVAEAIIIVNSEEVYINTASSIAENNDGEKYIIPIKKIGPGPEDFEIDFNIAFRFLNNVCNKNEEMKIKEVQTVIGPFKIQTEVYKISNYKEQVYPRMTLELLIDSFAVNKELIENDQGSEKTEENVIDLRKRIIAKLKELPLEKLKIYEDMFAPLNEEDSEDGEIINYIEDEGIDSCVELLIKKFKSQRKWEDLSLAELQTELSIATERQEFEKSCSIRDVINKKRWSKQAKRG